MFNDLKDQRVLITGSTRGIGLATAKAFAAAGAKVGINGHRHDASLDQLATDMAKNGGEVAYFAADVTKSAECEAMVANFVERFGGIDVLINNAGGAWWPPGAGKHRR